MQLKSAVKEDFVISQIYVDLKCYILITNSWDSTYDITYGIAITAAKSESDFRITTDTPYLVK